MKKIITAAVVLGFVAVPSVAFASHSADDTQAMTVAAVSHNNTPADRQENRREDRRADNSATAAVTPTTATTPGDDDDNDDSAASVTAITESQARASAQAEMPNKTITKVELENEEGTSVFSVRFSDGSRVDIDSSTGAVTRSENKTESSSNRHSGSDDTATDNSGRAHHTED